MCRSKLAALCALTAGLGCLLPATASAIDPGPFAEGSKRLSIVGGTATSFPAGETYLVLGAGFGYYVADGLEVGLGGEHWFLADPSISKISPQARYVLWFVPVLKPYAGAFYRHWFVGGGYDDVDTIGARGGAFYVSGGGSFFGLGVVHEIIVSACSGTCADTYPEFVLSISF